MRVLLLVDFEIAHLDAKYLLLLERLDALKEMLHCQHHDARSDRFVANHRKRLSGTYVVHC